MGSQSKAAKDASNSSCWQEGGAGMLATTSLFGGRAGGLGRERKTGGLVEETMSHIVQRA